MRKKAEIERAQVEAEETLDLVCELIGRIAVRHEWINAEIRRVLVDVLRNTPVPFESDLAERLIYAHSSAELRKTFLSVVSATCKRLTPGLNELNEFEGFISELGKFLAAENNARNHIIHSEYYRNVDMAGVEEIFGSSLASQKSGRYAIKLFNRNWLMNFIGFQRVLDNCIGLIGEDLGEGADLFEQAAMNAPSEEECNRRSDMYHAGELTPNWLVSEYLGKEILVEVRDAYKSARIGDIHRFNSDHDEGQPSILRSGWRPGYNV